MGKFHNWIGQWPKKGGSRKLEGVTKGLSSDRQQEGTSLLQTSVKEGVYNKKTENLQSNLTESIWENCRTFLIEYDSLILETDFFLCWLWRGWKCSFQALFICPSDHLLPFSNFPFSLIYSLQKEWKNIVHCNFFHKYLTESAGGSDLLVSLFFTAPLLYEIF